jgi:hypothetical protein
MDAKEPLPDDAADDEAWWRRCERDVSILRNAIVSYLAWLEVEELGNWQMTGAGQSYAGFRHRFMTHRLLVHADADALKAERSAMWTGRCEAYWHGTLYDARIDEWDLSCAYARIALRHEVPTQLVGPVSGTEAMEKWLDAPGYAVLADVIVDTAVPIVPTSDGGRILWPVGQFATTLWDPELRSLREGGADMVVSRAYLYRTAPALQEWAEWILGKLEAPDSEVPAWQKMVLKNWSRALIGRFGMMYRDWESWAVAGRSDCRQWMGHDRDTGETYALMQVGREVWRDRGQVEWDNSIPAITGWVMSQARADLWHLIRAMPPRTVLYVDTDSIITHGDLGAGNPAMYAAEAGGVLRVKRSWDRIKIMGPRQIIVGDQVRMAGIPIRAERMPDGTMRGEIWESLSKALRERRAETVMITPRKWKITGVDHRRAPGADGWTLPVRLGGQESASI